MTVVIATVASATAAIAAIAALITSRTALRMQRLSVGLEGRRSAAADLARWAHTASVVIERIHNPDNWRLPEGAEFGPETGLRPGDLLPPSQGRIGPVIEAQIHKLKLEPMRQLALLSFGPEHEVTAAVDEVIESIQHIANRGVISARDDSSPSPREYVLNIFWPRVVYLHEALEAALDIKASRPDPPPALGTNQPVGA